MQFTVNGKTVWVPQKPCRTSFSWVALNNLNLVFGRNVNIGGKTYLIRLMTGAVADPSDTAGGEWNDLIYSVAANRDVTYTGPIYANFTNAELGIDSTANSQGRSNYCRETSKQSGSYCVNRGYTGPTGISVSTKSIGNTNAGWRPILIEV